MAKLLNYLPDTNPFQLAGPPIWFQQRLWDFDPSLVIVPSRQGFFYRLTQRRPLKLPEKIVNDVLKEQSDTRMLASYSIVPITTILATVRWDNPMIFTELQERAPWRNGGAKKFEDRIIAQERQAELDKAAIEDDRLNYVAKDSWKFYQKHIGVRSHLWSPTVKTTQARPSGHSLSLPKPSYKPEVETTWLEPRRK